MKKFTYVLIFGIVSLTILSTQCTATKGLFKLENGNYLISNNFVVQKTAKISEDDATQLKALTVTGFSTTTVVHKKVWKDWVNETIYKHKESIVTSDVRVKVEEILRKYKPVEMVDSNYLVKDNYLVTSSTKITFDDATQLADITVKGTNETKVVHLKVIKDVVNETLITHKESIVTGDARVKVENILAKYRLK